MPTDPGDVDLRIREVPPSPESGDSDGAKPASTDDRWANREKRWQDTSRNW
jgi:hypothetical protein